jgi:hypothetical protein
MPSWLVHLQGAPSDLGALAEALGPGDPEVVVEGEDYYLKCNWSESRTNAREGFDYAKSFLPLLAKVMELATGRAPDLNTTTRIVEVGEDGTRQSLYHVSQTFTIPMEGLEAGPDGAVKATVSGAPLPVTTGAIRPWIREAQQNPVVEQVLLWHGERDWRKLYNALDAIQGDLGGWREISEKGWATKAQINHFKHTANSLKAIGKDARHGRQFEPPKKPMSMPEALDLVRHVVAKWLDSKSQKSPP